MKLDKKAGVICSMLRYASLILLLCCVAFPAAAQKLSVRGTIVDRDDTEALMGASVQLISLPDSSFVSGINSGEDGTFELSVPSTGKHAVKVSFIGYITKVVPFDPSKKKGKVVDLGYLTMQSDRRMLAETQVTAAAAKVQVSADSIVFNASAYRVPQGSTLEALVKLLPGAKVDDSGNITINGKTVEKILVDGKEFFLKDKDAAMKNIPVEMVDRIKSYDRKSDMARVTGIDDGEEETVLDLTVKKGMKNGWFGNLNAGAGTESRYNGRAMVNRFKDDFNASLIGNMRNTNERWGWNRAQGLNTYKDIGTNFATANDKLETGGSVMYRYNGQDVWNESHSEKFTVERGAFGLSNSQRYASNGSVNAQFRMEWKPDTMTNIIFRPSFTYSRNRGMSDSGNSSYDEDPDNYYLTDMIRNIMVSESQQYGQTYSNNQSFNGELQVNRRLKSTGRNITLRVTGSFSKGESQELNSSYSNYTLMENPITIRNTYYSTPSVNRNLSAQLTYSEPIADRTYLQFIYQYQYGYRKNDRMAEMYDSQALQDLQMALQTNRYDIDAILDFMDRMQYQLTADQARCRNQEHSSFNQTIGIQLRRTRKEYNMSFGLDAMPQTTKLKLSYLGQDFPEVTRSVFYLAPRAQMRWNFDQHTNLQFRYNARMQQPDMVDLLDITDDTNAPNVTRGNKNLKPSLTHNLRGNFHTFDVESQRSIFVFANANLQQNAIVRKTTTDRNNVTMTKPYNIDGNWNAMLGTGFNTGIGEKKRYTVGFDVRGNYSHNVGYYNNVANIYVDGIQDAAHIINDEDQFQESLTKNMGLSFGLNSAYRNDYINFELRGDVSMQHARNNVNTKGNKDTYDFNYGGRFEWSMPWGTELATDMFMNSRRGYASKDMNTNELLWNASLSHSFLRGKVFTIKADIYDILGQQTNITRSYNAFSRSDSRTNAIYQYAMITGIYRFSIFGGKNAIGTSNERQEMMWGLPGGGGRPAGPRPGGGRR